MSLWEVSIGEIPMLVGTDRVAVVVDVEPRVEVLILPVKEVLIDPGGKEV